MSVVLNPQGWAIVTDKVTGEVHTWPVPTALENVARGGDRYCHGKSDARIEAPPEPELAVEAPVVLRQEGTLDLPAGETGFGPEATPAIEALAEVGEVAQAAAAFDHDGDGLPGGSKPGPRPPRARPKSRRAAKK